MAKFEIASIACITAEAKLHQCQKANGRHVTAWGISTLCAFAKTAPSKKGCQVNWQTWPVRLTRQTSHVPVAVTFTVTRVTLKMRGMTLMGVLLAACSAAHTEKSFIHYIFSFTKTISFSKLTIFLRQHPKVQRNSFVILWTLTVFYNAASENW